MKQGVIVYGNCQCVAVQIALEKALPKEEFEVVYVADSHNPTRGDVNIATDFLGRCSVLMEQWTDWGDQFPLRDALPSGHRHVALPSVQFSSIWPFEGKDPRNAPEPPAYPYGRYFLGDTLAVSLLARVKDPEEALKRYLDTDIRKRVDLDRLHEFAMERISRMDAAVGVCFASFIEQGFRSQRMFWTRGHPNVPLLAQIAFVGTEAMGLQVGIGELESLLCGCGADVHVPVHPQVIEHFGLTYLSKDTKYRYVDGREFTFDEWMFRYFHGF